MTMAAWAGGEMRWQMTCKMKLTPAAKISRKRQVDPRAGLCYYPREIRAKARRIVLGNSSYGNHFCLGTL